MFPLLIKLRRYQTIDGRFPYAEWINNLDANTAGRIVAYIDRMKTGNFGHFRSVGKKVFELKINFGPGFRVYYTRDGEALVILLCGGDKSSQPFDIEQAHSYANDYWRRK